jgi:hypothetical protein
MFFYLLFSYICCMRLFATIAIFTLFNIGLYAFNATDSLQVDTVLKPWSSRHTINLTNNGVSIVPAFSLGQPAIIYTGSMGNSKFLWQPEVRMRYDVEPWSALLWGRYIVPTKSKWTVTTAAHYALLFAPRGELPTIIRQMGLEHRWHDQPASCA